MSKNNIKFFVPFQNEPELEPKQWTEFEDVLEYDSKIDNIVNTGDKKNLQVEIDAFKDQSLIYNILDKYIGISNPEDFKNIPELNKKTGEYIDTTQLPKNIHELKKLSEAAQKQLQEMERQNNDMENQTLFGNETNLQKTEKTGQTIKETNQENTENK